MTEKSKNMITEFPKEGVYFTAIGGIGEIGMNLYAYSYNGNIMLIDMGIGFAGDEIPSIDIFLPDVDFLRQNKDKIKGLVITHGHEDHIGAIPYGLKNISLDIPVYATPFVAEMIEVKLDEVGLLGKVNLQTVPCGGDIFVGGFEVSFLPLTHSILESHGLFIKAGDVKIFHTGDWRFDREPTIGEPTDYELLEKIGDKDVDYLMCDSTNIFVKQAPKSETEVKESLEDIIKDIKGKVIVTCFSSNVERIRSITKAAKSAQRSVCLLGRSLKRIDGVARAVGYLSDIPPFVTEQDAQNIPDDNILYICTGSQGEGRSVLDRVSRDEFKRLQLSKNDTVIFSSKTIPGNEKSIMRLKNRLGELKVKTISSDDAFVHTSGHPGRAEIKEMYDLIRPKCVIPIHGEPMHLREHADFANKNGLLSYETKNGSVLSLEKTGEIQKIGFIDVGLNAYDGDRIISMKEDFIRKRKKISYEGSAIVTAVFDSKGNLMGDIKVSAPDLFNDEDKELNLVISNIKEELKSLSKKDKKNDEVIKELIRLTTRRAIYQMIYKKPLTTVHLVRI